VKARAARAPIAAGLVLTAALAVVLAGCGVKAPPRPAASAGVESAPAGSGK
jgi:predicted small lipoprotein YifL